MILWELEPRPEVNMGAAELVGMLTGVKACQGLGGLWLAAPPVVVRRQSGVGWAGWAGERGRRLACQSKQAGLLALSSSKHPAT